MSDIVLTQTDDNVPFESGCAPPNGAVDTAGFIIGSGLEAGTVEEDIDPDNENEAPVVLFRTDGGLGTDNWSQGTHTFRIHITESNGDNIISQIHICEREPDGTYHTVQAYTDLNVDLTDPGVKTIPLEQDADYTAQGIDSDLAYVVTMQNFDGHGNSRSDVTPDQDIDTPYTEMATPATVASPLAESTVNAFSPTVATSALVSVGISVIQTEAFSPEIYSGASVSVDVIPTVSDAPNPEIVTAGDDLIPAEIAVGEVTQTSVEIEILDYDLRADKHNLYRDTEPMGDNPIVNGNLLAEGINPEENYTDEGLDPDTEYFYALVSKRDS